MLNNKLLIKKYGLKIFDWLKTIGNIKSWTDIEIEIASLIFFIFNNSDTFLFKSTIPNIPPNYNCKPKLLIRNGLYTNKISNAKDNDVYVSLFLYTNFENNSNILITPARVIDGEKLVKNI